MLSLKTQKITKAAMIAALYAALTLAMFYISFGAVQFRISEVLTVLPVFSSTAIPGLTIGCALANVIGFLIGANPVGLIDAIFGTAATLIAAIMTYQIGKLKNNKLKILLAPLPPVLINALVVGWEVSYFFVGNTQIEVLLLNMLNVFIGQFVVCYGLGVILMLMLMKNNIYKKIFS